MSQNQYPKGPVDRIDGTKKGDITEQIREEIFKRPVREGAEERVRPDQYRPGSRLPQFVQSVDQRIGSGYRTFRLPGTDYLVRDNRDGALDRREDLKDGSRFELKEGRMNEAKEKPYVNYFGDKMAMAQAEKGLQSEIKRLLSDFEKLLVERFEKGKTVELKLADEKPVFKLKADGDWKDFFSKFLSRTVWKEGDLKLMEGFLFRGLVALQKAGGKYSMLVGDMVMSGGAVEKFARLKVLAELAELLANLKPGSSLEKEMLRKGLGLEAFRYLSIEHKHEEISAQTSQLETKGMFQDLKTEEHIARELGIKRDGGKKRGYKGPIKWGEEGASEEPHAFVPWGWWEREQRGGWPRLIIKVALTIAAVLVAAGIIALIKILT